MTKRTPRTDDELKQIAKDIVGGLVFTDRHIPPDDRKAMLPMVFMPLMFADEKAIEQMKKDKIATLYEYYSKAGSRGINGYPIFASMYMLDDDEAKKVWEYHDKMQEALEKIE